MTFTAIILLVVWVVCGCVGSKLEAFQKRKNIIALILQKHQASTFSSKGVFLSCSQLAGYIAIEFAFRNNYGVSMQIFASDTRPLEEQASTNYPEPPLYTQNPEVDMFNPFRSSGYAKVPHS